MPFFGSSEPEPQSRGILEILLSFIFRSFIAAIVFVVILVILWQIFKHFFLRRAQNVIRPEFRGLVDNVRTWFADNNIREEPSRVPQNRQFQSDSSNCPICLIDPAEMPLQTNCGHVFCGNCIVAYWRQGSWGGDAIKCPVCRQKVTLLMRDMRPGVLMPSDANRAAEIEAEIRQYNRRFSGEPRSFLEKLTDLPNILLHFWQNFTLFNGLSLIFQSRIVIYLIMFVVYFILPFDLIPESLLGIFGLVDDLAVLGIVVSQLAAFWRNVIARDQLHG